VLRSAVAHSGNGECDVQHNISLRQLFVAAARLVSDGSALAGGHAEASSRVAGAHLSGGSLKPGASERDESYRLGNGVGDGKDSRSCCPNELRESSARGSPHRPLHC
jgi:hypothetical protein